MIYEGCTEDAGLTAYGIAHGCCVGIGADDILHNVCVSTLRLHCRFWLRACIGVGTHLIIGDDLVGGLLSAEVFFSMAHCLLALFWSVL